VRVLKLSPEHVREKLVHRDRFARDTMPDAA
jgi:hypothetical protein